jgi:hypothetical protein
VSCAIAALRHNIIVQATNLWWPRSSYGCFRAVRQDRTGAPQGTADPLSPSSGIRRLLDYLKARQQGYDFALAFHLANTLFQTACRFDELIQLSWADCPRVGEEIVALRIKGSVMREDSLLERCHRGRRRNFATTAVFLQGLGQAFKN